MDPSEGIEPLPPGSPLPASVNLYLHLSPMVARDPGFRARAEKVKGIAGFAYLHVETASLETALAKCLDASTIPPSSLSRSYVVDLFVRGIVNVFVPAGHAIGKASTEDAPSGSRQVGFTALCGYGAIDPSYIYDLMRDFVADGQPDVDAFLALVPKQWPVLSPKNIVDQIKDTETILYPWAVLKNLHNNPDLSASQWRQVGNNQKRLWQNRLLSRVGHAPAGSTDPPFEFDDLDWQNLFQLEAVVEFYANYDDPWAPNAQPRPPSDEDNYIPVDFLDPTGTAARAAGREVTLDGNPRYLRRMRTRLRTRYDTLFLENDTVRPPRPYLIINVHEDNIGQTIVTLDPNGPEPTLTGETSPWWINLRPVLVIIDSFGLRQDHLGLLKGKSAKVVSPNNPNRLTLQDLPSPNLSRVNPNFDTIYLPADTARLSRTYRIIGVNNDAAHTVTLDGNPILDGGSSAWHIPAGISGEHPMLDYDLGPVAKGTGFDHYDGVLFVLQNGEVLYKCPWSSFTSRNYAAGHQSLSSIRGNRRYDFSSYRSSADPQHPTGPPFRNYCFKVVDAGANYDGVREARFYFSTQVGDDSIPVGDNRTPLEAAPLGKTRIRLHRGNISSQHGGTGSAGCLVSPDFYNLRDLLIDLYEDEYAALRGRADAEVLKAYGLGHNGSVRLWTNTQGNANPRLTSQNWVNKIVGTLWVIRPDERPYLR